MRDWWNGRFRTEEIHASLHLYTQSPAALDAIVAEARSQAATSGVVELVLNPDGSPLGGKAVSDGKVHFGYVDGVGQPNVDWSATPATPGKVDLRYFLLGYDTSDVPSKPSQAVTGDLFRDGCYMGFRWLSQDVPGFEAYLDANAHLLAAGRSQDEARELLAAKLVGRWRDGTPLVLSPDRRDPTLVDSNFSFAADTDGMRCPFSAHIRLVNPRDQPLSARVTGGVPHLLRRGSSYGPEWVPGQNDAADRGLIGLFLCASLERQFLQALRWMNVNTFSPVFDGELRDRQDPLFGSPAMQKSPTFRIPMPSGDVEVPLPRPFVRSRGTAYLLVPSLSNARPIPSTILRCGGVPGFPPSASDGNRFACEWVDDLDRIPLPHPMREDIDPGHPHLEALRKRIVLRPDLTRFEYGDGVLSLSTIDARKNPTAPLAEWQ